MFVLKHRCQNAGHFKRDRGEPPSFSPDVATYVSVVKGWFEDTLPPFLSSHVRMTQLELDDASFSYADILHSRLACLSTTSLDSLLRCCT